MDYQQIVWLASYPKSGNTWLRLFLDAYVTGEVDINEITTSVSDDTAFRNQVGDGSDPSKYPIDVQMMTRPMALLRLVREYNRNMAEADFELPLFVKTHTIHGNANGMELIPLSLTKSVIYLVRDPRDVIVSYAKHMGKDMEKAIDFFFDKYANLHDERKPKMADYTSSWPLHVQSFTNADSHNVLVIRYEDMKAHPETMFFRILRHAGINPERERIAKALEMVKLSKLQKLEKEKGFRESSPFAKNQFFGKGETGGWKDVLTPGQLFRIEKACRSMMKRHNYEFASKAAAA